MTMTEIKDLLQPMKMWNAVMALLAGSILPN